MTKSHITSFIFNKEGEEEKAGEGMDVVMFSQSIICYL